jgi:cysteine-rich repeat protein
MKRIFALSVACLAFAGSASAQLTTTKYGLGHPADFDYRKLAVLGGINRVYVASDFQGSYYYNRSRPDAPPVPPDCGQGATAAAPIDRDYTPILGQILLSEDHGCVPTSTGPTCTAGTRIGAPCHLPLGLNTLSGTDAHPRASFIVSECGTGGVCTIAAGNSCTVQIPKSAPTTPGSNRSDLIVPLVSKNPFSGLELLSGSTTPLGGTSGTTSPSGAACLARNIQPELVTGQRYLLPASRGGNGVKTFIRWNEDPTADLVNDKTTAMYRSNDAGKLCCNSVTNTFCAAAGGWPEYDQTGLLYTPDCANTVDGIFMLVQTPDWIFDGGAATHFNLDPDFVMPGQRVGVCRNNREKSCTTLSPIPASFGPQTDCATLDADPATAGLQPDTCDFRENGFRSSRPRNLANGYPDPAQCGGALYVLRGTPGANCILLPPYEVDGDPAVHCDVINIGASPQPDLDCNGVADRPDVCPLLSEFDYGKDTDGDCGTPGSPNYPLPGCRGDECECGDHDLNGRINVLDIVSINLAIFGAIATQPICDTNLDYLCNVSDIVGANREIFVPGSSVCAHVTTVECGDGELNPAFEECDDGNRLAGDGCSPICRDE